MQTIEQMVRALSNSGMILPPGAIGQFEIYRRFLISWNHRMNLIARGDEGKIVERHFLESVAWLRVFQFHECATVLDLGTGAGFPRLPMSIMRPDLEMVLVDANRKKILFLKNLVEELQCPSVRLVLGRAEDLNTQLDSVDVVVSRAVSHAGNLVHWTQNILKRPGGTLLTLKGQDIEEEIVRLEELKEKKSISDWRIFPFDPFPGVRLSKKSHMIHMSA